MKTKYQPKYWNNKGKYQKQYEQLRESLVPDMGMAKTSVGEVLRIVGNIYYDHFNNGGCNLSNYKDERSKLICLLPKSFKKDAEKFGEPFLCYDSYDQEDIEGFKFADKFVDKIIKHVTDVMIDEILPF